MEKYKWLAAVIAAHPDGTCVGRTRLQKTVKLLQLLGAPLDYDYMIHFYGPYSEGVQADITLLENLKLVDESPRTSRDGTTYYVLKANETAVKLANSPDVKSYLQAIQRMCEADPVVLELAATYAAFREAGADRPAALERLKLKKGPKCKYGRTDKALRLLKDLSLEPR